MEPLILVEFCPCGHIEYVAEKTILTSVLEDIRLGKRLSAPVKHSSDCSQCAEDLREINRRLSLYR